jgi:hypothetical protein
VTVAVVVFLELDRLDLDALAGGHVRQLDTLSQWGLPAGRGSHRRRRLLREWCPCRLF